MTEYIIIIISPQWLVQGYKTDTALPNIRTLYKLFLLGLILQKDVVPAHGDVKCMHDDGRSNGLALLKIHFHLERVVNYI